MQQTVRIAELFKNESNYLNQAVQVRGWVRTRRDSKAGVSFIEVNDGSCLGNLQVIVETGNAAFKEALDRVATGSSLVAAGTVQASPGKGHGSTTG